jgi:hypothetical protein
LTRVHLERAKPKLFSLGLLLAAAVSAVAVLAGCGGGTSGTPGPISGAISVTLSPPTASVQTGLIQAFTATVSNDSSSKGVAWTLSGTGCAGAACGTISAASSASAVPITYTAPATIPNPASIVLTATSVADGTKTATAAITVAAAAPGAIAVSLSAATGNVVTNNDFLLAATVTNDSKSQGVTWTLAGAGCTGAACGTIVPSKSASGQQVTYTAPPNVPASAVTVMATSVTDPTKTAAATITVLAPVMVTLSQTAVGVNVNATTVFTATVKNDPASKGVTWALSGTGCTGATCGTITPAASASGAAVTYLAPATAPSPALVELVATSVADPTKQAAAGITITGPAQPSMVAIAPPTQSVDLGTSATFAATVTNDSLNKGVTWTISGANCNGAACGTVAPTTSNSGVAVTYTTPNVIPAPSPDVTLTATSITDPTKAGTATITITNMGAPISVTLTPIRNGLVVGQSLNFTATVTNDVMAQGVKWSASTGTLSAQTATTATYTAPNSPGAGITVTATSIANSAQFATATIGVTDLAGVTTYHNDSSRDGANIQEYALNTGNVKKATFGKLFSCPVDGAVYAQPLWVPNVSINGGTHNVIVVATMRDKVYAFDADTSPCTQYWQDDLIPSNETYGNYADVQTEDIFQDLGITGTPVIDSNNTIYLVTKTKAAGTTNYHSRLFGLKLATGTTVAGPVDIAASATGNCDGGSQVAFDPMRQNQRSGLALVNGVVYVGYGSHGDEGNWHGWLLGYQTSNLNQVGVFNTTPNALSSPLPPPAPACGGGIWMAGGAPAVDSDNNLYVTTGNGAFQSGIGDYGDSYVKLNTGLSVQGSFTPSNQSNLDTGDTDVGSSGTAVLIDATSGPLPRLLVGASKAGVFFVLNRDSLGGFHSSDNSVQEFQLNGNSFSTPGFWNNTAYFFGTNIGGGTVQGESFAFDNTSRTFSSTANHLTGPSFGFAGATPSISASSATTDGIAWAIDTGAYGTSDSGPSAAGPAVLHAFDASDISKELWNSSQSGGQDTAGNAVKFTVPTVANGKVYIGTRGNDDTLGNGSTTGELDVYGLLPN